MIRATTLAFANDTKIVAGFICGHLISRLKNWHLAEAASIVAYLDNDEATLF